MRYKGYETGSIEFNGGVFSGVVVGLRDVIHFEGSTTDELTASFQASIDEYLALCAERGEKPEVA